MTNRLQEIRTRVELLDKEIQPNDTKVKQLLLFIGISCSTILVTACLFTLFGFVDLRITSDIVLPPLLDNILKTLLFSVNIFVFHRFCLGEYFKHKQFLVYMLFHIVLLACIDTPPLLATTAFPVLSIIIQKPTKQTVVNIGFYSLIIGMYQFLSGVVKIHNFGFYVYECNAMVTSLYSIDLFLFYIYLLKGVSKYVILSRQYLFPTKAKSIFKNDGNGESTLTDVEGFNTLNARQKLFFLALASGYQVFQLLVVLAIGVVNNTIIELLIMIAMFWIGRRVLRISWHSDNLWQCSVITFSGFYILTKVSFTMQQSLFAMILLSTVFTLLLHYIGVVADKYLAYAELYEFTFKDTFESYEDFNKYKFTRETQEIAYEWKVLKLKDKEILEKHPTITPEALTKRKNRINRTIKSANVQ